MHIVELVAADPDTTPLKKTFCEQFRPAIVKQPGFCSVELLVSRHDARAYLMIEFESDALRAAWVETELHQHVWGQLAACCARYSSADYDPAECEEQNVQRI